MGSMGGECACAERLGVVEEQLRQLLAAAGAGAAGRGLQDQSPSSVDSGDTAWVLTATALVLFMTIPGQAIFYAGMVRTENVLATAMQVFSIACLMTVLWLLVGYSIAFGPADASIHSSGLFGDLNRVFLQGMYENTVHQMAPTIPEPLFCAYQLTFAIVTPSLMCGSFAERMRYFPCLVFMALWLLLVYCPVAHAIWHPDGFLTKMGVMDFAGGLVVHLNAGIASLMCVVVIGNRNFFDNNMKRREQQPHNILFTIIGCCMMWVAW
jgi:Amt family ammonium transporter